MPINHFLTQVTTAVSKGGLPLEAALDCITINAADAIGVGQRVGKIEEGYDADLGA